MPKKDQDVCHTSPEPRLHIADYFWNHESVGHYTNIYNTDYQLKYTHFFAKKTTEVLIAFSYIISTTLYVAYTAYFKNQAQLSDTRHTCVFVPLLTY